MCTTKIPNPSFGQKRRIKSWPASLVTPSAQRPRKLLIYDTNHWDRRLDATESRDLYEILLERYRTGSMIVTSNRGPDEWLATFADPVRAQSAIDRFTSNSYDLVIEGESY